MARKKKVEQPEDDVVDQQELEAALEELKAEFESLMTADVECGCGWAGPINETLDNDGQMVCPECSNGLTFIEGEPQMAKAKAKPIGPVKKLSDKLTKVNESFTINMYDNGYMIEVGGRNEDDDWKTAKIMVTTVEELLELVREATEIQRAD
jgi:hypothetical protein